MAGFVEFFFNLIPGGLFAATALILLKGDITQLLNKNSYLANYDILILSSFAVISIAIGFVLQGLSKFLIRDYGFNLNKDLIKNVVTEKEKKTTNSPVILLFMRPCRWTYNKEPKFNNSYTTAKNILQQTVSQSAKNEQNNKNGPVEWEKMWPDCKNNLYLIQNYLWSKELNSPSRFFFDRCALWSNIATGGTLLMVATPLLLMYKPQEINYLQLLALCFALTFAGSIFFWHNQRSYFDTSLKTFTAIYKIDSKLIQLS